MQCIDSLSSSLTKHTADLFVYTLKFTLLGLSVLLEYDVLSLGVRLVLVNRLHAEIDLNSVYSFFPGN